MSNDSKKLTLQLMEAHLSHTRKICSLTAFAWLLDDIDKNQDNEIIEASYKALKTSVDCSVNDYTHGMLLILLVREVEYYFIEIIQIILSSFPHKIGKSPFELRDILDLTKEELIKQAAEKHINSLLYKKPNEYLSSICQLASIDQSEITPLWASFIESKARRDLGIHNNWTVNNVYLRKLGEAGISTKLALGETVFPSQEYFDSSFDNCTAIIEKFHELLMEKYA